MAQGLRIWNAAGALVLDTNDRVAGGIVKFSTGTANGSYTATPDFGQAVEWVYEMPLTWTPSGVASRWPTITVSGNTISWEYNPAVAAGSRAAINIMVVTY